MSDTSIYENPLLSRYASREMAENFRMIRNFVCGGDFGSLWLSPKKNSG